MRLAPAMVFVVGTALPALAMGGQQDIPASEPTRHVSAGKPGTADSPPLPAGSERRDPPAGFVIGAEDVLTIVFWHEKELSLDVVVRPDGHITLPLLNDVAAAGLTPDQLREKLVAQAQRYVEEPAATVIVKQINSAKVFITGAAIRPGAYPLNAPTTVLQLIATAGGLQEYAKAKDIMIVRTVDGRTVFLRFNYTDLLKQKNLDQNITLRPGDTVVIPE